MVYIYIPQLLYSFICWWTSKLLPSLFLNCYTYNPLLMTQRSKNLMFCHCEWVKCGEVKDVLTPYEVFKKTIHRRRKVLWIEHCIPPKCISWRLNPQYDSTWMSEPLGGRASHVAQWWKNPPAMQETLISSLCQKDTLEKEMATHSSILAWEVLWTEEPGRLQSMGLRRVGHYFSN